MEVVLSNCSSPKMLTRRVVGRLGVAVRAQQRTPGLHRFLASQVPSPNDAFANGTNAYYADEMYRLWKQDPQSVHQSWNVYFSGMDKGLSSSQSFQAPPSTHLPHPADGAPALHVGQGAELDDHLKVCHLLLAIPCAHLCSGATSCSCLPSSRPPCRRARPPWHPGC